MTRFASNTFAALVAIIITASSIGVITQVPSEPQLATVSATVLA